MTKPFTEEQQQGWAAVYQEALALSEYMDRHVPGFFEAIQKAAEPRRPFGSHLAGLKEARNDLLEMTAGLSGSELRELDQHLRQKLGVTLDSLQAKRLAKIAALRDKGTLTTDTQFRLIYGRHEQIWDDPVHEKEAAELRELMAKYEDKVAQRVKRRRGA